MMRITNSMMTQSVIRNINDNMQRLNESQQETSTGLKIQEASDDPIAATKTLQYRSYIATIEQYQSNASDATSWMKVTEDTLSALTDAVQQIRDLTSQASNDILEDTELDAISAEVTELKSSIVELMNTQYAGRYIFGGYATSEAPYDETTATYTDTAGETTSLSTISFKDEYLSLGGVVSTSVDSDTLLALYNANSTDVYSDTGTQEITYKTGYSSSTAVNVEGQDVTGTGTGSLFDTIDKLLLGLDGETNYQSVTQGTTVNGSSSEPATITGAIAWSYTALQTAGSFTLTIDGADYTVNTSAVADSSSLQTAIDAATDSSGTTLGSGLVTVEANSNGGLTFSASNAESISISESTTTGTAISALGLKVTTTDFTMDGLLDEIDANLAVISTSTSDLGARMNYVETCTARLASDYTTYTGLLSENIDSDISVSTTEYATAQTIYDASLSVGAKVITKSLVDYLT